MESSDDSDGDLPPPPEPAAAEARPQQLSAPAAISSPKKKGALKALLASRRLARQKQNPGPQSAAAVTALPPSAHVAPPATFVAEGSPSPQQRHYLPPVSPEAASDAILAVTLLNFKNYTPSAISESTISDAASDGREPGRVRHDANGLR